MSPPGRTIVNGNGNGYKPALPFRPSAQIPIVGQPFKLTGWFLTLSLQCQCDAREGVLIVGQIGAGAECTACHRVYQIQRIDHNAQQNHVHFGLAIGMGSAEADSSKEGA